MRSLIVKELNGSSRRRKTLRWDAQEEATTWNHLIHKVEQEFSVPRHRIQLSLNHGKTFIEAEDSTTLSQLNIVNGDILTLVAPSDDTKASNLNDKEDIKSSAPREKQEETTSPVIRKKCCLMDTQSSAMARSNSFRLGIPPSLMRDVRGEELPLSFQQLLAEHGTCGPIEQLILAVHTLMLESGFLYNRQNQEPLLDQIRKSSSMYKIPYSHVMHEDSNVTVACVPMANHLVVHAAVQASRNLHLKLPTKHYLTEDGLVRSKLVQLSNSFKDLLVAPLILAMKEALNMEALPPVLDVPYELIMLIFAKLDFKSVCRLGTTCKHLSRVAKDNTLWKRLYCQRFGAPGKEPTTMWGEYWYQLYRERVLNSRLHSMAAIRQPQPLPIPFYTDPFAPLVPHLPSPIRDDPFNQGLPPLHQSPPIGPNFHILGLRPPRRNPYTLRLF
ncbi:F-box only protein 7-like [Watersipora subatra]|uniref:F-box only protein 7-like n=1 Tax=Watersipora subatra TaxID=2589382 RepID=UPI00355B5B52